MTPMVKSTHDTATNEKYVGYLHVRIPRRILFKLNSHILLPLLVLLLTKESSDIMLIVSFKIVNEFP